MPKGQKIVDWTKPDNDQKLLLAILKVCDIPKKYGEIAAAFGGLITSVTQLWNGGLIWTQVAAFQQAAS